MDDNLNGAAYLRFLEDELPQLLAEANLPPEILNYIIFQHDGCPAHFFADVRAHLNRIYPARWIGRGSNYIPWPPRSPDFNVCDFFLWSTIKERLTQANVRGMENTWQAIQNICREISPIQIENATRGVFHRAELCIANNGGHFENFL